MLSEAIVFFSWSTNLLRLTPTVQPTATMRHWCSGEKDVAGWLVGQSGYTGMWGLLFVWERSGSGGECHWWLQGGRMNLQEVFLLSPSPPTLVLSVSIVFFFQCVRTFTVPSLSPLRPRSPGTTTALSCPVNTHTPPLLGAYVCQGMRNMGPRLLFLSTSLPLEGCDCVSVLWCWMINCVFAYPHF